MILICDKTVSPRALTLQSKFHERGCPVSVCAMGEIKNYLPAWFIITFTDSFDDLRRTPYDHIFALVIGDGFVNTALNATRVSSATEVLSFTYKFVLERLNVNEECKFPFGVMISSVFFSERFIDIYGNIIPLSDIEMLIFRYIFFCSSGNLYASVDMIEKYCYSADMRKHRSDIVPVHIANINKKAVDILGRKIISSMRYKGYYIDK